MRPSLSAQQLPKNTATSVALYFLMFSVLSSSVDPLTSLTCSHAPPLLFLLFFPRVHGELLRRNAVCHTHAECGNICCTPTHCSYVIVVEHDLSVLDYLSDFVCVLYGMPGVYGVVTMPFSVREGMDERARGIFALL